MANSGVPQIDYSFLSDLPDQFATGRAYQRQNQLRDAMGSPDAQAMIKAGDFRGLAALAYRIDPAYGQKLLAQEDSDQLFGTPIWGRDTATGKEGIGAFTRNGQFRVLETGQFQPERGVTMRNLGYGEGAFGKGTGELQSVTPRTGPLPEGYIPPQGFQPFGPGGGTQSVSPPPQSGVGPLPQGFAPAQPQELPSGEEQPQAAPAQPTPPMPGGAPAAPQAAPVAQTGGYMPGTEQGRKSALAVRGRTSLGEVAGEMAKNYEALIRSGNIRVVGAPWQQNLSAGLRSSPPGQFVEGALTTEAQSIRDRINNAKPGMLAQMRAATELSARSLDSNIELQFYMAQLGSTGGEGLANVAAIDAFARAYGEDPDIVKKSMSPALYQRVKKAADHLMASRPRTLDALAEFSPQAAQAAADLTQTGAEQGRQAVPQNVPPGAPQGRIAKGSPEEAEALRQARDAIARGADEGAVLERLKRLGIEK